MGVGLGLGPSLAFLSASHLYRPTKGTKCWAGSDADLAAYQFWSNRKDQHHQASRTTIDVLLKKP